MVTPTRRWSTPGRRTTASPSTCRRPCRRSSTECRPGRATICFEPQGWGGDACLVLPPENLGHLLTAFRELNARYRDPPGRHIEPDLAKLETLRLHRLLTDLGAL